MTALAATRTAALAILLVAVPLAAVALLAWLIFAATPREQWAGSGGDLALIRRSAG